MFLKPDELCYLSAVDLGARIRAGTVSPVGVLDSLRDRTLAVPPFSTNLPLGPERIADVKIDPQVDWAFTWPFNLTGQPAVSIPCGWTTDGLPLGLQLVGRRGADCLVLRVAAAIEALAPWSDRRPKEE
jgi:aspartyl-tRNA(Asn)/glutamyl-tRNA(Gln) amidotransferase subunit A